MQDYSEHSSDTNFSSDFVKKVYSSDFRQVARKRTENAEDDNKLSILAWREDCFLRLLRIFELQCILSCTIEITQSPCQDTFDLMHTQLNIENTISFSLYDSVFSVYETWVCTFLRSVEIVLVWVLDCLLHDGIIREG